MIRNDGMILFEVIVSCLIIVIFAVSALRMVTWYDAALVRLELDTLYFSLLSHAYRAISDENVYEIQCHEQGWITSEKNHDFAQDVVYGVIAGTQGPPAAPKGLVVSPITFFHQSIVIHPDGKIRPGTVYLTDSARSVCYALSCPVGKISYIRRYRYYGGNWVKL